MHKVLVVGCGGSGAKTLSYMMDQLKSTLPELAPDLYPDATQVKLPKAWGFVSVDVPETPETFGQLSSVIDAGGSYVPCGTSASYANLDGSIVKRLIENKATHEISTWLVEEPQDVGTNLSNGAGQYRRLGRMLFLSKAGEIRDKLDEVYGQVMTARDLDTLNEFLSPGQAVDHNPYVFVVSSMAGGAGASMAIDVCEVLKSCGISPTNIALFAVTPDIFSDPDKKDAFEGCAPNSLGMMGEAIAARYGAIDGPDRELYAALGTPLADASEKKEDFPFARLFPVGAHIGISGINLGGLETVTPDDVYRALGRGLSGMMLNHKAFQSFWNYNLTNQAKENTNKDLFWDKDPNRVAWGSFGFSQLSMGRDRYAEYSAQRIARSCVDRLLRGHIDPESPLSPTEQLDKRWETQGTSVMKHFAQILPTQATVHDFAASYPGVYQWYRGAVDEVLRQLNTIPTTNGQEWLGYARSIDNNLYSTMFGPYAQVPNQIRDAAHQWARSVKDSEGDRAYAQDLVRELIRDVTGSYGAAFALYVMEKLQEHIRAFKDHVLPSLPQAGLFIPPELVMGKRDTISNPSDYVTNQLLRYIEFTVWTATVRFFCTELGRIVDDFLKTFLNPMRRAMQRGLDTLRYDENKGKDKNLGIAQMKTNFPQEWPAADNAKTPYRFSQAANEVFLTSTDQFPTRFREHVEGSVAGNEGFDAKFSDVTRDVVKGVWPSEDNKCPDNLLVPLSKWVPPTALEDDEEISEASFDFTIDAKNLLDRARQFINAHNSPFDRFISESLSDYVAGLDGNGWVLVKEQFMRAVDYALPLAQLNRDLVHELYGGEGVSYNFSFSEIPFGRKPELVDDLNKTFSAKDSMYKVASKKGTDPLGNVVTSESRARHIDIYGSYPSYAAWVFQSVMEPITKQRDSEKGKLRNFWRDRRARPIPAAIPLTNKERRAMVGGWYLGLLTGMILAPLNVDKSSDNIPVQIAREYPTKAVLNFESPLLTTTRQMRRGKLDWLPAILESYTLACARCGVAGNLSTVEPYVVLRQLFDDGDELATPDSYNDVPARRLWKWLAGETGPAPALTMSYADYTNRDTRYATAKRWLESHKTVAESLLFGRSVESGASSWAGMMGAPQTPMSSTRQEAFAQPLIIDIAQDVVSALTHLLAQLDKAYEDTTGAALFPNGTGMTVTAAPVVSEVRGAMIGDEDL